MLLYSNGIPSSIDMTRVIIELIRFCSPGTLEGHINILIYQRLQRQSSSERTPRTHTLIGNPRGMTSWSLNVVVAVNESTEFIIIL